MDQVNRRDRLIDGLIKLGSTLKMSDMEFLAEVAEALKELPDEPVTRIKRVKIKRARRRSSR
jgi:hypothetical protein